jgi:hypothetical protein
MRKLRILILVVLVVWLIARCDRFLVVDDPGKSDVIVVLAGETDRRPARALELLQQNYAKNVVVDVPADERIFGSTAVELAQKWAASLPQASQISVCPIHGLSTKAEAIESGECVKKVGAGSILLVTSDFHTRRAASIFRHQFPNTPIRVAAAYDSEQFGDPWWRHRQWAKTNFDEWVRLIWWEFVDRWLA